MQLCFFEDEEFQNFHPLTLTRPVDNLRIGILTIAEKWQQALGVKEYARILRTNLRGIFEQGEIRTSDTCIWINSRYLPSEKLITEVQNLNEGTCLKYDKTVIAACVDGQLSSQWKNKGAPDFNALLVLESNDYLSIQHQWDLFQINGNEIRRDLKLLESTLTDKTSIPKVIFAENEDRIIIKKSASIEAGCVLDARNGPIYVAEDATIMADSVIRGPVAICAGATIKVGAKIYENTTIGPVCKAGGEINNTIFHSYSNKIHDGYIGNSVVGQWCNLGAGTTVSNLKNNYSSIRIANWNTGELEDSGQQFFGVIMGDHSKTAVNTVINSGTICGVNCNLLSREFPPKLIHSFSWVGTNVIQTYKLDKALKTIKTVMDRRDVEMTKNYTIMLKHIFDNK